MNKKKSVIVSMLVMIPIAGILIFLYETSIWKALPFVILLAVYGFYSLWRWLLNWLRSPDTPVESKKHLEVKKYVPKVKPAMSAFDIEFDRLVEEGVISDAGSED